MRISLRKKIFINFLILCIVPIICIDTYFFYKSKAALINRTFDQLTTVRIEKTNRLKDFFNQQFYFLESLTQLRHIDRFFYNLNQYDLQNDSIRKFEDQISQDIKKTNPFNRIIFITPQNKIWSFDVKNSQRIKPLFGDSVEIHSLETALKKLQPSSNPFIYDVKNEFSAKHHSILMAQTIIKNNKQIGTIILEVSLNAINKIMYENNPHNGLGKTGETYLVGSDFFMRSSSRFKNNSIFNIKVNTEGAQEAFKNITGTKQILDYRKIPVLSSYSKVDIPELNWVILAEIDTKEAMIPIYSIRNDIVFMSLILSILLFGLVEIFASKITAPVKKLKQTTDKISEGQIGSLVNAKSNDEIGDLIIAFNKMIAQLKDQANRLENERILRTNSLFDGQEMERQRLSRELHDSLGQSILALKMKFEQISEVPASKRVKIFSEAENLFQKIMTEIRNISNDLMPAVLTEFGLLMAIKKLTREFYQNTNIEIEFEDNLEEESFSNKIEVHIYRIIQEAFNNILKHAEASKVRISIMKTKDSVELQINDNGKGFTLNREALMKGNGISNIRERINLLGGKIDISSNQEGTNILCKIPIS